jgi:hypothetical protein
MFHLILTINSDYFLVQHQRSVIKCRVLFGVKRVVSILTTLRQLLTFALRVTSHLVVWPGKESSSCVAMPPSGCECLSVLCMAGCGRASLRHARVAPSPFHTGASHDDAKLCVCVRL